MASLDPADLPDLPVNFMNADHQREVELVNALEEALSAQERGEGAVDAVLERLSLLAVHTREHFMREESMMREAGFPAYPMHKAEHDRVLAEMNAEARAFRDSKDGARLARYLGSTLPSWFRNHVRTMDVVTARFVAGASTFAATR
jgi:hemerythrin